MACANSGIPLAPFTTEQALNLYSRITGYDPSQTQPDGSNPTDQGTSWTDALTYWLKNGIYGFNILGWAKFDWTDQIRMNQAIDIFGSSLTGLAVTKSMRNQF